MSQLVGRSPTETALMGTPPWERWPSNSIRMGLKLGGSSSIVILTPDQGLPSGLPLLIWEAGVSWHGYLKTRALHIIGNG